MLRLYWQYANLRDSYAEAGEPFPYRSFWHFFIASLRSRSRR